MKLQVAAILFASLWSASAFAGEYKVYYGNLHSHTGISDGEKGSSATDAYTYARDKAKIDFFAVTDHEEQIGQNIFEKEWDEIVNAANATAVPGKYVTIYGYEWGSPVNGHINFFMQDHKYTDLLIYLLPVSMLWAEIEKTPAVLMQFNHPKGGGSNWDHFKYNATVAQYASLIEIRKPITADDDEEAHEKAYVQALDNGWHVSAVSNQDNHGPDWGDKDDWRTAVWTDDFSRAGILDALKAGRTYSTGDKNLVLWFSCDGHTMGDSSPVKDMSCVVKIDDPDPADEVVLAEVVTRGGLVVWSSANPAKGVDLSFTLKAEKNAASYFYTRVLMKNNARAWSGPIYYREDAPVPPDAGIPDVGADTGDPVIVDSGAGDAGFDDAAVTSDVPVYVDGSNVEDGSNPDSGMDSSVLADTQPADDTGLPADPDGSTPDSNNNVQAVEVQAGCACSSIRL